MSARVTFRNAINDQRTVVEVRDGQTVRQAVEQIGFIAPGNDFSVRDKNGLIVDQQLASSHANTILSVGLAGDSVQGGASTSR